MIRFKCQSCGEPLTSPDSTAGETGRCPHCEELFDIPRPKPAVLRLVCPGCDKTLGVPATAAGKPSTCPACRTQFLVPDDLEPEPAPAPRSRPRRDDDRPRRPESRRPRDEDDDEPVARGRRVDDDDDEDDDDERPTRRSKSRPKKRRRSRSESSLPEWYRGPLGRLAENAVVTVLLLPLIFVVPVFGGFPLMLWGMMLAMVGSLWFTVITIQAGIGEFLLCAIVPFYSLFFMISHWEDCKHAMTVNLIGVAQMLFAIAMMAARGGIGPAN